MNRFRIWAVATADQYRLKQLGKLAAWANREFYSSKGRGQRILEDEHINPFPLQIFKSYMKSMDDYAKKAGGNSRE